MALHLPIGHLKTRSGLEPVPRCEPSTISPLAHDITTAPSEPVFSQGATVTVIYSYAFPGRGLPKSV